MTVRWLNLAHKTSQWKKLGKKKPREKLDSDSKLKTSTRMLILVNKLKGNPS